MSVTGETKRENNKVMGCSSFKIDADSLTECRNAKVACYYHKRQQHELINERKFEVEAR